MMRKVARMEKHQPNIVNSRGRDLSLFLKMTLVILDCSAFSELTWMC